MTIPLGPFGAVLLCDDIRKEISQKDILIGVYGAGIIVPEFPAVLRLALYLEYYPPSSGEQTLFFRFHLGAKPAVTILVKMNTQAPGPATLAMPGIQCQFDEPGELQIQASNDENVWTTIKRVPVTMGTVVSLPTPSIESSLTSNR